MTDRLPKGFLLAYYGDDFTGSTDAMEVLSFNGLPTVLFFGIPDDTRLQRFADYRAVGIAGIARSQTPAWMEQALPPVFAALARLGAPINHYKVCSTLDSSPRIGSIGKAIELGRAAFGQGWVPTVIGAPRLRRYQAFGNLFATVNGVTHRLDRHPTMSRHPVTPMNEGDVRLHLARQTDCRFGLVDILALQSGHADERLQAELAVGAEVVVFDVMDEASLSEVGRLIWEHRSKPCFSASSSGLQYALIAHLRAAGLLPEAPTIPRLPEAEQIIALCGSCSPVTAGQIEWGIANGFAELRVDPIALLRGGGEAQAELARVQQSAARILADGGSPLIYSARGPDDVAVQAVHAFVTENQLDSVVANETVGRHLGQMLASLVRASDVRRIVVAGGDTSGHCAQALGIYALTAAAPLAPGGPLCRAHADDPSLDGLEIALKGGQIGGPDFFGQVKRGCV